MDLKLPQVFIQDYDYAILDDKIALHPSDKRDESKLLVYKNGQIEHLIFHQITSVLPENSFLIFNNTKVIPARIFLKKNTGTSIELFLLRPLSSDLLTDQINLIQNEIIWECLVGNKKRWKDPDVLLESVEIKGEIIQVKFSWDNREENKVKISWGTACPFSEILNLLGKIPLPPYIERSSEEIDSERYQTVFSKELGAVAAPTASLHFTNEIIDQLPEKDIKVDYLTLHVGAGTFLPVKVDEVGQHPMHREQLIFSRDLIEKLMNHQGNFIPVGTTALRALESLYWSGVYLIENSMNHHGILTLRKEFPYYNRPKAIHIKESMGAILDYLNKNKLEKWVAETELLIMPGYQFQFCDALITNFHQPKSTLLVLISALVGDDWKNIYHSALEGAYRFFSYGDSSILFKKSK
ncbi:S-adenosylmethionine:tRNA ribosyltransferase-isomerase [Aquirufa sp. ROCK2-A2]